MVVLTSQESTLLIILTLGTCLMCLYLVFIFGRRVQMSALNRESIVEGVYLQELNILHRELLDGAKAGPLDPKHPPPEDFGPTAQLYVEDIFVRVEGDSEEEKDRRRVRDEWEQGERLRYNKLLLATEPKAKERAERKVPTTIDISLLGGGFTFLLEFSTVIVIIFALVMLGILGTLGGEEISTILAAIAG